MAHTQETREKISRAMIEHYRNESEEKRNHRILKLKEYHRALKEAQYKEYARIIHENNIISSIKFLEQNGYSVIKI